MDISNLIEVTMETVDTVIRTYISYPLIPTRTCGYQGVRNVSFSENFAYVLNE